MKNNRFKTLCAFLGVGACCALLSISFISQRSFKQASAYTYDSVANEITLYESDFYNYHAWRSIIDYRFDEGDDWRLTGTYYYGQNGTQRALTYLEFDNENNAVLLQARSTPTRVDDYITIYLDDHRQVVTNVEFIEFFGGFGYVTSRNSLILSNFKQYGLDIIDRFQFLDSFTYNAPYLVSPSNQIVQDTYFSSISVLYKQVEVYSGYFFSNGNKYDKIIFNYGNAQGSYFEGLDDTPYSGINYGFFLEVWYKNSDTGVIDIVCKRNQSTQLINNGYVQRVDNGVTWSSGNYKTINFTWEKNDTTLLEACNSVYGTYTGIYNDNDVGLGGAFSLISTAFNAVVGLFTIQIFPGLTLGLLVLLPLIAGIIVLIIWIVKR